MVIDHHYLLAKGNGIVQKDPLHTDSPRVRHIPPLTMAGVWSIVPVVLLAYFITGKLPQSVI